MTSSDKFSELIDRIATLRDPMDGCPWDRAQDHMSLRPYMLEEAYEAIAAIDAGIPAGICDELGDVLLQVVLHAQIASEAGEFSIHDVIDGLNAKLVRRHPHVFSDASSDLPSILKRWNDIKASEKPSHKGFVPPLVEARKFVDARMIRKGEALRSEGLGAEAKAGLEILSAIAKSWKDGFEPEIALRKAIDALNEQQNEDQSE
jgi:uncharacterized protein YabN with tetrapyrrole methylase and pyrophosphatase domain